MTQQNLSVLTEFYNLITRISVTLIKHQSGNLNDGINHVLEIMGKYADVERSYVFTFDFKNDVMTNEYEWCAKGIKPEIANLQNIPIAPFPEFLETLHNNKCVHYPDLQKMVDCADKEFLLAQDIKSLLAFPMFHEKELLGFIGFDAVLELKEWTEEHLLLLKLACNILGTSISRQKYHEELVEKNRELEQAIANVKMLQGILPVCSHCKRIRDEEGKWHEVVQYVHEHSEAQFSHGICPDCGRQLYPGMEDIFGESS